MERRMRKQKAALRMAGVLCLVAGLLAGCGKGEDKKEPTPTVMPGQEQSARPTLSPEKEDFLSECLADMTLEEKVGQMFLVRCPENAAEAVKTYALGGYVLFARDFEGETKESLREKVKACNKESKYPLLFSVDEEGGAVVRVSKYKEFRNQPFASQAKLYNEGGLEAVLADVKEKAALLRSLGIFVNLAPVCDVCEDSDAFIYTRSLGKGAQETADYVSAVVAAMKEAGLGSTLKHFPGYGNNADTHTNIVRDTRPYETFVNSDFLPFSAGIKAGADAVMVAHNIVECMDASRPASLSLEVHRILREELGFEGVIITDDLYMDGITEFTGAESAAVAAVLAGNDMLCCTDFAVQIPAVIAAVKDGRIDEAQIDESVLRILRWKLELGLLREE